MAEITVGRTGCIVYGVGVYLACGILDQTVLERTVAGDSYGTGFFAARHYGLSVPEAMRWGSFNAAYVVGRYGGILGLVRKAEMELVSKQHPELKVREI